jgi:hypothetical protein
MTTGTLEKPSKRKEEESAGDLSFATAKLVSIKLCGLMVTQWAFSLPPLMQL